MIAKGFFRALPQKEEVALRSSSSAPDGSHGTHREGKKHPREHEHHASLRYDDERKVTMVANTVLYYEHGEIGICGECGAPVGLNFSPEYTEPPWCNSEEEGHQMAAFVVATGMPPCPSQVNSLCNLLGLPCAGWSEGPLERINHLR